jgi:glucose-6-phosphate 1-dehydrogenase
MADPAPVLVLLGGAGDLSMRMLLPSLLHLEMDSLLPQGLRIIAVGRAKGDAASYRKDVRAHLEGHEGIGIAWEALSDRLDYLSTDAGKPEGAEALKARIGEAGLTVIYYALSPSLFAPVTKALSDAGLIGENTRLVLEKPIGRDLESSRATNAVIAEAAEEGQVFRIDHYLGKETVQNLIALRFANALFEPLWNNLAIDHVQITVAETQEVGDRWRYYDEYGAIRDMLQNHMLQLLCLVAMEPPSDLEADAVRNEKVKVLRSLRRFTPEAAEKDSVRGSTSPAWPRATLPPPMKPRSAGRRRRRPSSPWSPGSTTGAGRACPSTCAPASGWPSGALKSSSSSRPCPTPSSAPTATATSRPTAW